MDEKDNSRSSLQTAADLGRAAKAAYRIAQAAAVSGVHGAAAAAVKETVPALVKFLLVVLLIMIVIPMVVFTALPNIFFGYDSSDTASVIHMTEQAMRIGGAYMSLDDFERTQIDSIVTGIAAEYEADGTAIDHIEVKNTMKEDDLLWIIAINSAAYEQDLDAMSAELIQNFCQSTLSYQPSLSLLGGSTSATLEVEIKRIDPEELMEQMGFNEDARQWAGALFETLKDSGALEKYGGYFNRITAGMAPIPAIFSMVQAMIMTLTFPVLSARLRKIISTLPPMRCRRGRTTGAMCGELTAIFSQSPSLPIKSSSTRTESAITLILLKQTGWDGARQTASA